jgi:hypothetical protein
MAEVEPWRTGIALAVTITYFAGAIGKPMLRRITVAERFELPLMLLAICVTLGGATAPWAIVASTTALVSQACALFAARRSEIVVEPDSRNPRSQVSLVEARAKRTLIGAIAALMLGSIVAALWLFSQRER